MFKKRRNIIRGLIGGILFWGILFMVHKNESIKILDNVSMMQVRAEGTTTVAFFEGTTTDVGAYPKKTHEKQDYSSKTTTETTAETTTVVETTTETTTTTMVTTLITEVIEETTNITEVTEELYVEPEIEIYDGLIIGDHVIDVVRAKADQQNVDAYDVVQDNDFLSGVNKTYLFGHNNRSFRILDTVNVGDRITLVNEGNYRDYVVQRSELGTIDDLNEDIILFSDNSIIVKREYDVDTIILITCATGYARNYRWVVIATIE